MLNIFLGTAKSCFPHQRIFHASNLSVECEGLWGQISVHRKATMASQCGGQALQPDCLGSQS